MKIFQAFSLLTIAHGSKITRINFRKEGEGLGSRLPCVRRCFLSENAAMPPVQQVKVHKSAGFVNILEVCKFKTFCDRKGQ